MTFWGAEVAPGEPFTHHSGGPSLRLTQAILGKAIHGSSQNCSVECTVGCRPPVKLCSLIPGVSETCPINVDFHESDQVIFSVIGTASVHLIGNLKPADDATTAAAVLIPEAAATAPDDTKDVVVGISERRSVDLEKESVDEKEKHQKLVEEDDVLVEKKSVDKKKRKSKRKVQSEENAVKDNSGNAVKVNSENADVKDNSENAVKDNSVNVINEGDVVEVSAKKKSKRPKHLRPVKTEKTDI